MSKRNRSFDVVKFYIKQRKGFIQTLEYLGYRQTRMKRDTPLIDDIGEFLRGVDKDLRKCLQPEFDRLVECRWNAVIALQPLLRGFLNQKGYREQNDVSNTVESKMMLALEKAVDRMDGVNPRYVRSWLQASWTGIINRDFTEIEENEGETRLVPRLRRYQFTDSYSDAPDTIIFSDDTRQSPEHEALDNVAPTAEDCFRAALQDAEMIGEKMVIAEAEKLLERFRAGRSTQIRKNCVALSKLKALLAANGAMEVIS